MSKLPINIEDLLRQRTVESDRIEYKQGWNPAAILQTICAFANDFDNVGGGYVVVGQKCDDSGLPIFPPVGLNAEQLDSIQLELHKFCQQIRPHYFPVLSVEEIEGRHLIVIWVPGGQNRPYSVPRDVMAKKNKEHAYFIRRYSSTVHIKENSAVHRELLSLTATVPFDDRQCQAATIADFRSSIIREYLTEVGSELLGDVDKISHLDLCRQMRIADGPDESVRPQNVGLLFFSADPKEHLPGAQIDVVIFPKGPGGGDIIEKIFVGPIHEQVRSALRYLQNEVLRERVTKLKDRPEAVRIMNYPLAAIEEALVNAVYHRSYESPEPVEVRVNPDRIEIVSYPGPDASIKMEALNGERLVARRYRNRRIGDFLKELELSEGRCTGIPTMREAMANNGSPPPRFQTDQDRTYFFVELLAHKNLQGLRSSGSEMVDVSLDELPDQTVAVLSFLAETPKRKVEIAELLGLAARSGSLPIILAPLIRNDLIEFTIPDKPRSRNQKYRITGKGRALLEES